jgi:hypothetical protein
MQSKSLIVLTLMAAVLISSAAVAVAAADDNVSSSTAPSPDPKATFNPDQSVQTNMPQIDSPDNSTVVPPAPGDGEYHILADPSTAGNSKQGATQDNIVPISAPADSDNTLAIIVVAAVIAGVVGCAGLGFYRKQAKNAEN